MILKLVPSVFFAVTGTPGNMGTFGAHCCEEGIEHGYCFDHNCHRNAINAFDGESFLIFFSQMEYSVSNLVYPSKIKTCQEQKVQWLVRGKWWVTFLGHHKRF